MTTRFLLKLALGAAAVAVLGVAAPALACGKDCDCAKKTQKSEKKEAKEAPKPAEKPAADKKAELGTAGSALLADGSKCQCEKGGKGCTCKKGECKCANCGQAKFTDAEKCKCKEGGKECSCPKGKCACHGKDEKKAA